MTGSEYLRDLPLFAGLSDADLARLYEMAEAVILEGGEVLMEEGSLGDALYVALDGLFEVTKRSGEREVLIAGCGPGDVIGEISLLEQVPRTATVRAVKTSRLIRISRAAFEQLLAWSPTASLAVLRAVMKHLRNTELMLRQNEKMAALGTLSAGLAHELNNPAAAIARSSSLLGEALAGLQAAAADLDRLDLPADARARVQALREELPTRQALPAGLDALALSDREAELQTWLEDEGAADAWELAPAIAGLGWGAADLAEMTAGLAQPQRLCFANWLAAACNAYALVGEVNQGSQRISEIVNGVKSYAHLDQAPVQLIDIHAGIENTLIILRHKLGQGVAVVRDYAAGLPRIEAYAGELNQVWTNIIDNAIDAMGGKGELRIRTYAEGEDLVVEITDNGPGMPAEVQERIFDAFYTTKPLGDGTGLGLHISYNIVVHQHRGEIKVTSHPGETTFRVTLPVRLVRR